MVFVVQYEDMTDEERDRFVYLVLGEKTLEAVVRIMQSRHGPRVSTDRIMRFAFKVARNRMIPKHLKTVSTAEEGDTE